MELEFLWGYMWIAKSVEHITEPGTEVLCIFKDYID